MLRFNHTYSSILESIDIVSKGDYLTVMPLDAVKDYLGIDYTYDDVLLTSLINAVCERVEKETNISLVDSSYIAFYSELSDRTLLPYFKANTLTSVKSGGYDYDLNQLELRGGKLYGVQGHDFEITYDSISSINEQIKQAINKMIKYEYDNNEPLIIDLSSISKRPII